MRAWSSVCSPLACLLSLTLILIAGCAGQGPWPSISVSPNVNSVPVNGTQTFTATSVGHIDQVNWSLWPCCTLDVGTLTPQSDPATVVYHAPSKPPVSSSIVTDSGDYPGTVVIHLEGNASTQRSAQTSLDMHIAITTPSLLIDFNGSKNRTVALGSSISIDVYVIGNANTAVTLLVNGISGGSSSVGTVIAKPSDILGEHYGWYIYTAPTSIPITGNTITITAVSVADPTKTVDMTVMLQ